MRDTIEFVVGILLIFALAVGIVWGIVYTVDYFSNRTEQIQCKSLEGLYPDVRFTNDKTYGCVFRSPSGKWFDANDFEILHDELFSK